MGQQQEPTLGGGKSEGGKAAKNSGVVRGLFGPVRNMLLGAGILVGGTGCGKVEVPPPDNSGAAVRNLSPKELEAHRRYVKMRVDEARKRLKKAGSGGEKNDPLLERTKRLTVNEMEQMPPP